MHICRQFKFLMRLFLDKNLRINYSNYLSGNLLISPTREKKILNETLAKILEAISGEPASQSKLTFSHLFFLIFFLSKFFGEILLL